MANFSQEKWAAILDAIEWFQLFCREHDASSIRALCGDKVASERLDQRMSREKLESAIAWFSAEEKPNGRRVTRGDLHSMLLELRDLRIQRQASPRGPTRE